MKKPIFEKEKFDPAEALYYAAFVLRAPACEIEKIRQNIVQSCKVRLIYQCVDLTYLKICRAAEEDRENE